MAAEEGGKRPYHHGDLRRALLEAAEAELIEKGVEGFSLRGCAKRAGVSHAAPAHHFTDAAGLLSALTAEGFRRFADTVARRQAEVADGGPRQRMAAAGRGYVEFALANPALFRLMFTSKRPDHQNRDLSEASTAAFLQLVDTVAAVSGPDPLAREEGRYDVAATWGIVHGLAELMLSGRIKFLAALDPPARDRAVAGILERIVLPKGR